MKSILILAIAAMMIFGGTVTFVFAGDQREEKGGTKNVMMDYPAELRDKIISQNSFGNDAVSFRGSSFGGRSAARAIRSVSIRSPVRSSAGGTRSAVHEGEGVAGGKGTSVHEGEESPVSNPKKSIITEEEENTRSGITGYGKSKNIDEEETFGKYRPSPLFYRPPDRPAYPFFPYSLGYPWYSWNPLFYSRGPAVYPEAAVNASANNSI